MVNSSKCVQELHSALDHLSLARSFPLLVVIVIRLVIGYQMHPQDHTEQRESRSHTPNNSPGRHRVNSLQQYKGSMEAPGSL